MVFSGLDSDVAGHIGELQTTPRPWSRLGTHPPDQLLSRRRRTSIPSCRTPCLFQCEQLSPRSVMRFGRSIGQPTPHVHHTPPTSISITSTETWFHRHQRQLLHDRYRHPLARTRASFRSDRDDHVHDDASYLWCRLPSCLFTR